MCAPHCTAYHLQPYYFTNESHGLVTVLTNMSLTFHDSVTDPSKSGVSHEPKFFIYSPPVLDFPAASFAPEVRQRGFSLFCRVSGISGPFVEFPEFLETLTFIISSHPGRS
jgi:hypothetical protein